MEWKTERARRKLAATSIELIDLCAVLWMAFWRRNKKKKKKTGE
jgi:hypothetical protein